MIDQFNFNELPEFSNGWDEDALTKTESMHLGGQAIEVSPQEKILRNMIRDGSIRGDLHALSYVIGVFESAGVFAHIRLKEESGIRRVVLVQEWNDFVNEFNAVEDH